MCSWLFLLNVRLRFFMFWLMLPSPLSGHKQTIKCLFSFFCQTCYDLWAILRPSVSFSQSETSVRCSLTNKRQPMWRRYLPYCTCMLAVKDYQYSQVIPALSRMHNQSDVCHTAITTYLKKEILVWTQDYRKKLVL